VHAAEQAGRGDDEAPGGLAALGLGGALGLLDGREDRARALDLWTRRGARRSARPIPSSSPAMSSSKARAAPSTCRIAAGGPASCASTTTC